MKVFRASLIIVAVALAIVGLQGTSYAFHDGGVAYCEGCHTMHNSQNGVAVTTTNGAVQFNGQPYLLKGSDQSSTCLNCHQKNDAAPSSYHVMSGASLATDTPVERTPGGDFAWLKMPDIAYTTSYGSAGTNLRTHRGHNIVAADKGLVASAVYPGGAPGGTYPENQLYCSSCHDPHARSRVNSSYAIVASAIGTNVGPIIGSGSYGTTLPVADGSNAGAGEAVGVYRLLGGVNYAPDSVGGAYAFVNPSPFAFAPSTYNRTEAVTDTRVAYGSGMSEWCANCHTQIHNPNYPTTLEHPTGNNASAQFSNTDANGVSIMQKYNAYVYSGNLTGAQATSYTSMVPYEEGLTMNAANYADLATRAKNDGTQTGGPTTGNENVMCLSCHRAHASGWPYSLRWNGTTAEFLTLQGVYPGVDSAVVEAQGGQYNLGYTTAQVQATFYGRPATNYATYQRQLCNKCHAKD